MSDHTHFKFRFLQPRSDPIVLKMHTKLPHLAHPKYRPDIDGLRAVAIIAVIMFHFFPARMQGGFIGVDIFFVISGFLISTIIFSSLERERFSLREFYIRRIRRIFPALILVLVISLIFGWFVLNNDEYRQLGMQAAAGAGFIQNFALWHESGYFDADASTKPLLHLWSLAIEEQFYIFWPLLLAFVWKRNISFLKITSVIAAASFAANIYLMSRNSTAAFYFPISRFWELMIGGLLAYISLHRPTLLSKYTNQRSLLGFFLILLGFFLLNKGRDFPGWWALLPTLGAFFIISARGGWLNEKILANKLMVGIGLISYPLYLWHWPLLTYLRIISVDIAWPEKLAVLSLTMLLAWLTYKYVEKPFRIGGNPRKRAATLFGILIIVGMFGAYARISDGFPGRKIVGIDTAAPKKYDFSTNYRLGECFLNGTIEDHYAEKCLSNSPGKPMVVIWGDSYAASMYQGLLKQSSLKHFNLTQYTTSGCPPVFDFDVENRKGCASNNQFVLNRLKSIKPDTVVLTANWLLYDGKHHEGGKLWNYLSDEKIISTINALKSLGIHNIVLIGQLPNFTQSQVTIGLKSFRKNINNRTYRNYVRESNQADDRIRSIAKANKIPFISPIDTLCNESGCLISTSLSEFVPLAWDEGHLTTKGSEYFIETAISNKSLALPSGD